MNYVIDDGNNEIKTTSKQWKLKNVNKSNAHFKIWFELCSNIPECHVIRKNFRWYSMSSRNQNKIGINSINVKWRIENGLFFQMIENEDDQIKSIKMSTNETYLIFMFFRHDNLHAPLHFCKIWITTSPIPSTIK